MILVYLFSSNRSRKNCYDIVQLRYKKRNNYQWLLTMLQMKFSSVLCLSRLCIQCAREEVKSDVLFFVFSGYIFRQYSRWLLCFLLNLRENLKISNNAIKYFNKKKKTEERNAYACLYLIALYYKLNN